MRRFLFWATISLVCGTGASAADKMPPPATLIDGVAAYVNESVITIAEVMSEVQREFFEDMPPAERERLLRRFYYETLDAMINRRLIIDSAKAAGAQVAPWAVDQRVQEVINRQFGGDRAKLTAVLVKQRFTFEEWRKIIEEDLVVQLMRYNNIDKHLVISGQAVRNYYAANTQLFTRVSDVGVSMIVVAPDANASAADLGARALQELADGKPFDEVAKAYSVDNKGKKGGSWGKVNPEVTFRRELVEALARLKAGEHSPLLLLEEMGYIIRKDSEAESEQLSLEQAWPLAEARLKAVEGDKKYIDWLNRLRKKAFIKVFDLPMG